MKRILFSLQIKIWMWKSAALSEYMIDFSQEILQSLKKKCCRLWSCIFDADYFVIFFSNFFFQAILLLSQKHTVKHEQHDGREEGLSSAWWGLTYVTIYVNKSEAEKLDSY